MSKIFLATADHCGRFERVILPPRHRHFPDGGRLTLTAHFLAISARVGAFSMSRSDLELDKSVEDPEAADACSMLLSDSLLSGQFGVSAILHVQGNVSGPDRTFIYYNKLLYRLIARLFPYYARYLFLPIMLKIMPAYSPQA